MASEEYSRKDLCEVSINSSTNKITRWKQENTREDKIKFNLEPLNETKKKLRPCLHGVGDPGLVGKVSFVLCLPERENKRNQPR